MNNIRNLFATVLFMTASLCAMEKAILLRDNVNPCIIAWRPMLNAATSPHYVVVPLESGEFEIAQASYRFIPNSNEYKGIAGEKTLLVSNLHIVFGSRPRPHTKLAAALELAALLSE